MDNLFQSLKEKYATITAYISLATVTPLLLALSLVSSNSLRPKWLLSLRGNFTALVIFLIMLILLILNIAVLKMKGVKINTFVVGPNRMPSNQFKNMVNNTQGELVDGVTAGPDHPVLKKNHGPELNKESFIASNLPLWTEK